jgi:hypothetical protein
MIHISLEARAVIENARYGFILDAEIILSYSYPCAPNVFTVW